MTAEVAILNRGAVALAADSATTVTYWEGGREQVRYFKGANKIFNISTQYPVGLMIYNAADLQGMPWEVIAKAYRAQRGTIPHDHLDGYANDFFDFINTDGHLFPADYQEKQLTSNFIDAFQRACYVMRPREGEPGPTTAEGKALIQGRFQSFSQSVYEDKFIAGVDQEFVDKYAAPFFDEVLKAVAERPVYTALAGALDAKAIFKTGVTALFKAEFTTLAATGLVIAGYGERIISQSFITTDALGF